ncbi:MAG: hypothetical protein QME81_06445 [bacterium]|nr:hypothetical protein [bacterium]
MLIVNQDCPEIALIPDMKARGLYNGIVEGNIICLEKQVGLPAGTQILVMLKTLYKDEQKEIKARQMKLS